MEDLIDILLAVGGGALGYLIGIGFLTLVGGIDDPQD